jgi:hypothetical protein
MCIVSPRASGISPPASLAWPPSGLSLRQVSRVPSVPGGRQRANLSGTCNSRATRGKTQAFGCPWPDRTCTAPRPRLIQVGCRIGRRSAASRGCAPPEHEQHLQVRMRRVHRA